MSLGRHLACGMSISLPHMRQKFSDMLHESLVLVIIQRMLICFFDAVQLQDDKIGGEIFLRWYSNSCRSFWTLDSITPSSIDGVVARESFLDGEQSIVIHDAPTDVVRGSEGSDAAVSGHGQSTCKTDGATGCAGSGSWVDARQNCPICL